MEGFEGFEQQDGFGTSTNATNLDFGESAQEDIFAGAGMSMNSQSNMGSNMNRAQEDDLTPEEQEIIQRVESEMQEKKRQLFEKQNSED